MNQVKIGKFIASCRKIKKLTQQELASKLGVTDKAISKWENGRCLMDISLLKPLSDCLGVTIIELISGEKIEEKDISNKSTEVVEKTIDYASKKIKKTKIKISVYSCLIMLLIVCIVFCSYKGVLLYLYGRGYNDNIEDKVAGLGNKETMTIYKRTINEEDYLVVGDIKIRNDFKNFELEESINEFVPTIYRLKDSDGNTKATISFGTSQRYIDAFAREDVIVMTGMDQSIIDFGQFNSVDRKYFLLKNDINDDLDFFNYVVNNKVLKSNLFTGERKIKENYAYNLFVNVAIPVVDGITIINGDYTGVIFNLYEKDIRQVSIYRNNLSYNFLIKGKDYITDEYILDLFSTLEIKLKAD